MASTVQYRVRWDRPYGLSRCRRIRPRLDALNQSRSDRVPLNVADGALKFAIRTYPAIERFILPERAFTLENCVREMRRVSLEPLRNLRYRHIGTDQQMDMVRHYHPRSEFVKTPITLASSDLIRNGARDTGIGQPAWPVRHIERTIDFDEGMTIVTGRQACPTFGK